MFERGLTHVNQFEFINSPHDMICISPVRLQRLHTPQSLLCAQRFTCTHYIVIVFQASWKRLNKSNAVWNSVDNSMQIFPHDIDRLVSLIVVLNSQPPLKTPQLMLCSQKKRKKNHRWLEGSSLTVKKKSFITHFILFMKGKASIKIYNNCKCFG